MKPRAFSPNRAFPPLLATVLVACLAAVLGCGGPAAGRPNVAAYAVAALVAAEFDGELGPAPEFPDEGRR